MTSARDREALLSIARMAIKSRLVRKNFKIKECPNGVGGVFVTLKIDGMLRGCIGRIQSDDPIHETVRDMALSAAFSDPRFLPLSSEEFKKISIEISRISAFFPIIADDVKVGTHGLMLSLGCTSGLLLPQVPEEQGWNRQEFLSGLCHKAGLPDRTWNKPDAVLEAFTAEVFGEK